MSVKQYIKRSKGFSLKQLPEYDVDGVSRFIVHAVLLIYPATMFVYDGIRSEYFGIFVILSVVLLATKKVGLNVLWTDRLAFFSMLLLFSMGLFAWFSYAYFGFPETAKDRVAKYSWFLLIPLVFLGLSRVRVEKKIVFLGVSVGCIVAFLRAILEELELVDELAWGHIRGRANGIMHPVRFGDLVLLMAFVSLSGAMFLEGIGRYLRILGVIAFGVGVFASILSLTRGSWVAIPFFLLLLILGKRLAGENNMLPASWLLVAAMLFSVAAAPFVLKGVDRFGKVYDEIIMYMQGNPQTSSGARLSMLETAGAAFKSAPLIGVGVGGYEIFAKEYYSENKERLSSEVAMWKNPHNELMLQAATRGILGALLYLLTMLVLFALFYRTALRLSVYCGVSGMMVVLGFFIYGMTISIFEHRDFLLFFSIYISVLMSDASYLKGV